MTNHNAIAKVRNFSSPFSEEITNFDEEIAKLRSR